MKDCCVTLCSTGEANALLTKAEAKAKAVKLLSEALTLQVSNHLFTVIYLSFITTGIHHHSINI